MQITPDVVSAERKWMIARAPVIVDLVNETRRRLGMHFDVDVDPIDEQQYRETVDHVFADGEVGVNVAAYVRILRDLDVIDDYPGFVVDEVLGRELAATIAGRQPLALLAQATFHYADLYTHGGGSAGADDLDAALAAGVQTRLPGWSWRETDPFGL